MNKFQILNRIFNKHKIVIKKDYKVYNKYYNKNKI